MRRYAENDKRDARPNPKIEGPPGWRESPIYLQSNFGPDGAFPETEWGKLDPQVRAVIEAEMTPRF